MKFEVYALRIYGEPKLPKPKELRGIAATASVGWMNKAKFQIFISGNDVWVKHRDYFSDVLKESWEDFGAPLSVTLPKYANRTAPSKWVYSDAWGAIVLRNEAWLVLRNFVPERQGFPPDLLRAVLRQQESLHHLPEYELECTDMSRFWEHVIRQVADFERLEAVS